MEQDSFVKIKEIMTRKLRLDPAKVTPKAHFEDDLKVSASDWLELVKALNEEFGNVIAEKDLNMITSGGDVMTYVRVFQKVKQTVAEKLNVAPAGVVPQARFSEDLKADLSGLQELFQNLNEEFSGAITEKMAAGITTFGQAVSYLVTFEKVKEIVADRLNKDPLLVVPAADFRADLGADSLDLVELIQDFESRFGGVAISDKDVQGITTVGAAVAYLSKAMA